MTNGLKILTAGMLVAFSAFAEPKLDEFYGVRLGMNQAQFLSAMQAKGFDKFADLEIDKDWTHSKNAGVCTKRKITSLVQLQYYMVSCGGRQRSSDSVSRINVILQDDVVTMVTLTFERTQAKKALAGIIKDFGYPTHTSSVLRAGTADSVRAQCLERNCHEGTWTSGDRELLVGYTGNGSSDSEVIYLVLKEALLSSEGKRKTLNMSRGKR
jgi:hypothetical protein